MTDDAIQGKVDAAAEEPSVVSNSSPSPATAGYIKCSLCNNIIDDEASHTAQEHGHLQRLKAMLHVPVIPPTVGMTDSNLRDIGDFVVLTSQSADRGVEAFRVMQEAQKQLHRLLEGMQDIHGYVYAFGSVVSMGCWDGVGDGDFAFINPQMAFISTTNEQVDIEEQNEDEEEERDTTALSVLNNDANGSNPAAENDSAEHVTAAPQHHGGIDKVVEDVSAALATDAAAMAPAAVSRAPPSGNEKRTICSIAARLRSAGFCFDELEPVLQTRIPVLRRKKPMHDPLDLRAVHKEHLIRFCFDSCSSEGRFLRSRLQMLISTYDARVVPQDDCKKPRQLVLAVKDGCDAVHLMSRRERIPGVQKEWLQVNRRPEIFSIDFDLSCHVHGIRNSWLLRKYMEQDEVFRMGNVFLKKWSKACNINNSRLGFLTSYAVSVLWVYFLLRRGEVTFVNPDDVPVLPDAEKQMAISYIPLWPALDNPEADAARTVRLGALMRDFFYFYGEEFDWTRQVVTIRQPCPSSAEVRTKVDLNWLTDDVSSLRLRDRCYHILSIEDVYEDDLDLGRHLTPDKAAWTLIQFRLAYLRCLGKTAQLTHLLDVPRKRASDVLQARLYHHLLFDSENAESTVEEIAECLCREDGDFPGEDPAYLLGAYELGNRLSDLWYDEAQINLDVANHRRYDHRINLYSPPRDPTKHGKWAPLCKDPLPAGASAGEDRETRGRRVRLEPPENCINGVLEDEAAAQGAPKRKRGIYMMQARNQYAEALRLFSLRTEVKGKHIASTLDPTMVGLMFDLKEFTLPDFFYALLDHRVFCSYSAREVFLHCLNNVTWEVTRLLEESETDQLDGDTRATLSNRQQLLEHLKERLHFWGLALPGYAEVLDFVVLYSHDYLHLQVQMDGAVLGPSPQLLDILSADGGARGAPTVAPLPARPAAAAPSASPNPAAWRPPLKKNKNAKKMGTCDECKSRNILVYSSNNRELDSGFYCSDCWSRY
ncbi:hypothetical protein ABL78_7260 [Leptomonas seymouri]|uniref:RNA uridylyltransferase n=1 Tax=Leptomonas seymouri TaxID=5684 RepID=A0A0N1HZT3_LEPSE|nr:hypothetical protein ABL78_7260 [Leptomonas seymouri]|eukprot:KPI83692.1 hypothetical protein ABL78_7260 [Leptomonas seymouri]